MASAAEGQSTGVPEFFKPAQNSALEQGDLIPRGARVIQDVLAKYHGYHVEKPANEMFAVLTQSCDLVRHEGKCKARYIALAPVRPLRVILDREFRDLLIQTPGGMFTLGSQETKVRYDDLLRKLINNNDSRYFFVPQRPELHVAEDMCIMLPLSLAIRADHYDACVEGRVAQLTDLFQAKLGWLLGQQYSRVGTPDWGDAELEEKVLSVSNRTLSWIPDHEYTQLKSKLKAFAEQNPDLTVDQDVLASLRKEIEGRRDQAITAVLCVMERMGFLEVGPSKRRFEVRKELRRDPVFARLFPGG
jgi:hypothetical protein